MITTDYCRMMARYNTWQNGNLYRAAETLSDAARHEDQGAFFGSIHGTLAHLLWGDHTWMSRFDGWEKPKVALAESPGFVAEWSDLATKRRITDARITRWVDALTPDRLEGDLSFYSGVLQRDVTKPFEFCVVHFFNHQTHHRGQVHAMLTRAGARPDDTDLFVMPDP